MGFFEQIGNKLSDATNTIKEKTQDFAETSKLNSTISDKEKQIIALYQEIGYAYYERHREDASCADFQRVSAISTLVAEIAQHKEEIKKIKGVEKCPRCNADVALNAVFCPACGLQMSQAWGGGAATIGVCKNCGNPLSEGTAFCNRCGAKVE